MEKKITTVREPARDIPVRASADILIVGGGPAGLMAAQAAAGEGLKVMLVESRGYLGGNLTIGLPILGFLGQKGNQIIEGLPQRFIDRLQERGAASGHRPCKLHVSLTIIDPEESKTLAQQLMEEAGVEVLMYVFCTDVIREGNEVKGVVIESKAGREAILARTVIDCTGDADVAFRAGVECRKGDAEGGMQPPTLMFSMRGVATQRLRDAIAEHPDIYDMDIMPAESFRNEKFITVGLRNQIAKAREAGIDLPVARTILITGMSEDEIWVNMSRVNGVDPTDPGSYTRGVIEARKQVYQIRKYLRQFVPGFENAWMDRVAPFMGIRESRVTVGKYVLTAGDILACRRFDDAVAVASYPVDLHHPKGGDCTLEYCGDCYDIPYRVLVPAKVENLLVAGRCASFTHEAMASTRVMSTCMALGEAAGRAARIALRDGVKPSQADVAKLRSELKRTGAYLRCGLRNCCSASAWRPVHGPCPDRTPARRFMPTPTKPAGYTMPTRTTIRPGLPRPKVTNLSTSATTAATAHAGCSGRRNIRRCWKLSARPPARAPCRSSGRMSYAAWNGPVRTARAGRATSRRWVPNSITGSRNGCSNPTRRSSGATRVSTHNRPSWYAAC